MSELPVGWTVMPISEVGAVITGSTPSTSRLEYWGSEVSFVTPGDLAAGRKISAAQRGLTAAGASQARVLPTRAVLVCCIGSIGKASVALMPCASNQQINAVVVDEALAIPEFVLAVISSPQMQRLMVEGASSTTLSILNKSKFCALDMPLPPLNEQRRIVAAIEEHLSRLDAADASLQSASRRLTALRAASRESVVRADAEPRKIGDLVTPGRKLAYGVLQPGPHVDGGVPFVRVGDLKEGRIASDLKHISEEIAQRYPRTSLLGGEVLLSLVGTIGRTAVVSPSLRGANVARAVAIIPLPDGISSEYVALTLGRPSATRHLDDLAHEVARKTLNLEDVREFEIPLPSLDDQRRAVARVGEQLSVLDALRAAIERARLRSASLRRAMLDLAFRGELVPQDPSDEPASVLLERIQVERAATPAASRRRRTTA